VTPRRGKNADSRSREYLTEAEVERLMAAARKESRYGSRDATLVLLMFRHGLRVSEAVALRWDAVHLEEASLNVARLKNGKPSTHPLTGDELRALRKLRRDWPDSPFLFCSERGGPMTADNVRKLVTRLGRDARFAFPVHPHMLRHSTGYKLANDGRDTRLIQDYLGHKNITHTVRYTELAQSRFKGLFKD
jgi:type 1 fimbriae regulatory protein FimB/type 1 fimbriae regulatory protein FimE